MTRTAALLSILATFLTTCAPHPRPASAASPVRVTLCTSMGDIELELDPAHAPITVQNFIAHANRGDYNGTIFHRVVKDFVIQGGGWTPDLKERAKADADAGHPDTSIRNEWTSGLRNVRGTIAMARDEQPDTATREFYINLKDNPKLDTARPQTGNAGYAVFGRVTTGLEVVDAIGALPTTPRETPGVTDGSMNNVPIEPVFVRRVVVR